MNESIKGLITLILRVSPILDFEANCRVAIDLRDSIVNEYELEDGYLQALQFLKLIDQAAITDLIPDYWHDFNGLLIQVIAGESVRGWQQGKPRYPHLRMAKEFKYHKRSDSINYAALRGYKEILLPYRDKLT